MQQKLFIYDPRIDTFLIYNNIAKLIYRFNLHNFKDTLLYKYDIFIMVPLNSKIRSFVNYAEDKTSDFSKKGITCVSEFLSISKDVISKLQR